MIPYEAADPGIHVYTVAELEPMSFTELQDVYRDLPVRDEGPHAPTSDLSNGDLIYSIVRLEADAFAQGLYDDVPGVERYTREDLTGMERTEQAKLFDELGCVSGPSADPDLLPEYILMGQRTAFQRKLLTEDSIGV